MTLAMMGWAVAAVFAAALSLALRTLQSQRARLDALARRTPDELRAAAAALDDAAWREKAGAFQGAYADAKERAASVEEMPSACVYGGCDEEPVASIVDTKGHVTGLCRRHSRMWARLDEDERRRVRIGDA